MADKNYPPGWEAFDGTVREFGKFGVRACGFSSAEMVNRFAARYRAARCFRRIEFEGYTKATADGYSALCQLFLTYSAFEYFLKTLRPRQNDAATLLTTSERRRVLAEIRSRDPGDALFTFVRPHVTSPQVQRELDSYLAGQPCNLFRLASSIRHTFAHGVLTPNPGRGRITSVAPVSRYFTRMLFGVMGCAFERRVEEFERPFLDT